MRARGPTWIGAAQGNRPACRLPGLGVTEGNRAATAGRPSPPTPLGSLARRPHPLIRACTWDPGPVRPRHLAAVGAGARSSPGRDRALHPPLRAQLPGPPAPLGFGEPVRRIGWAGEARIWAGPTRRWPRTEQVPSSLDVSRARAGSLVPPLATTSPPNFVNSRAPPVPLPGTGCGGSAAVSLKEPGAGLLRVTLPFPQR